MIELAIIGSIAITAIFAIHKGAGGSAPSSAGDGGVVQGVASAPAPAPGITGAPIQVLQQSSGSPSGTQPGTRVPVPGPVVSHTTVMRPRPQYQVSKYGGTIGNTRFAKYT